jgi:SAM-dependent methyltransferase
MHDHDDPTLPSTFDDAELYDMLLDKCDYGVEFYTRLAQEAQGPVLDVACGTGRILIPCLRAGVDIEGLDYSPAMLDKLRMKLPADRPPPRLTQSDMSHFQLDRQFALVMIPFNAFGHNLTQEAQLGCLRTCRDHLQPGGLLAFDGYFPSLEIVGAAQGTRVLEGEIPHPESGRTLRMYDTRRFDRVNQIQHSVNEVEFLDAAGNVSERRCSSTSIRWVYKGEMALLLQLSGFSRWEISADFAGTPLERESDGMVVRAWR